MNKNNNNKTFLRHLTKILRGKNMQSMEGTEDCITQLIELISHTEPEVNLQSIEKIIEQLCKLHRVKRDRNIEAIMRDNEIIKNKLSLNIDAHAHGESLRLVEELN